MIVYVESVYDSPLQSHCCDRLHRVSLRQSTSVSLSCSSMSSMSSQSTSVSLSCSSTSSRSTTVYDSLRRSTSVSLSCSSMSSQSTTVHFSLTVVIVYVESVYDSPLQSHCRACLRRVSLLRSTSVSMSCSSTSSQSTTVHFSLTVVLVNV